MSCYTILSDNYLVVIKYLESSGLQIILLLVTLFKSLSIISILYCHWSHQPINLFTFANTTRKRSISLMWWMTRGCYVLSRLNRCKLVVMVD